MRRKAFILFVLSVCFAGAPLAQEGPELFSKIGRVFKDKEPAWRVEREEKGESTDPLTRSFTFRSGAGQASVSVAVWRREKDAREVFAAEAIAFGNTMGKRMSKAAVPELGDEGYIWTHPGSAAWPVVVFRKGRVNVRVFAPSVPVAKRFARHVLGQFCQPPGVGCQ